MKSYSETNIFSPVALTLRKVVERLVELLPDPEPGKDLWRCHEVARAVEGVLETSLEAGGSGARLHVFDGKYGPPAMGGIDHSWLVLLQPDKPGVVLDPYAIGRLPQVQIIDWEMQLACMYKASGYRNDIDKTVVQYMVDVWRPYVNGDADDQENKAPGVAADMRWIRAEDYRD